ncbi:MAG: Ribonuclease HI (EC [uncultured Campylobacterales bacterium]|uniref:Ribonuclease HI n=1 Tax=uncultured Campylobacterales bacterium TaxID=352960 RepID=A0A6S6S9Q9_9BACT|nr:MAG: Ribonuclease HI (EC [uncultured Campylobacterales bacterium]
MKHIKIYTDGSSLGNPGFGGYCAILKYKDEEKIISEAFKDVTNNQMELLAVIEALKTIKEPCNVEIYSDSTYVVKAVNEWLTGWVKKNFKNVKNIDLWKQYLEVSKSHTIQANWVKAHNGHPENERCDTIARDVATKLKEGL